MVGHRPVCHASRCCFVGSYSQTSSTWRSVRLLCFCRPSSFVGSRGVAWSLSPQFRTRVCGWMTTHFSFRWVSPKNRWPDDRGLCFCGNVFRETRNICRLLLLTKRYTVYSTRNTCKSTVVVCEGLARVSYRAQCKVEKHTFLIENRRVCFFFFSYGISFLSG